MDNQYKALCAKISEKGKLKPDYTRVYEGKSMHTVAIPSAHIEHDMSEGFPLLTIKKMAWKGIAAELCLFLKGLTNIEYMHCHKSHIWDKDAYAFYKRKCELQDFEPIDMDSFIANAGVNCTHLKDYDYGDLGPVYGSQWRSFNGKCDQLSGIIRGAVSNPYSNRHYVTAWNPEKIVEMALPPCHYGFGLSMEPDAESETGTSFSLYWDQRSVDVFLGLPFNIASYAMLGALVEAMTGHRFKALYGHLKNVHIYEPHIPAVMEACSRDGLDLPKIKLSERLISFIKELNRHDFWYADTVFGFVEPSDFIIEGYTSHPAIKAEMFEPSK